MEHINDLNNKLLIATPSLDDPYFNQSVAFIYEHNEEGSLAFVINKPSTVDINELLKEIDLPSKKKHKPHQVLVGGPIAHKQVFVVSRNEKPMEQVSEIDDTKKMLETLMEDTQDQDYAIFLGYAGWGSGQLEKEIANNDWLLAPGDLNILFNSPATQRWQAALDILGIDGNRLSLVGGEA
jgi:putative transcriptional regulator